MTREFDEKNMAKSRKVCEAMADAADTGKRALSERERRILDMWPRFEDGECVMVGDEATSTRGQRFTVKRIEFRRRKWMLNDSVTEGHYLNGKFGDRVERPSADSWERLEGDAVKGACEYGGAEPSGRIDAHDCDTCRFLDGPSPLTCEQRMCADIVRRAKALAGVD